MTAPEPREDVAVAEVVRQAWHETGFYARADLDPRWLDGLATITAEALAPLIAERVWVAVERARDESAVAEVGLTDAEWTRLRHAAGNRGDLGPIAEEVERILGERVRAAVVEVVKAVEAELDDADQIADTLDRPNRIAVWGIRRTLMPFGGKPHRWPMPAEFCIECGHLTYSHDEECLQPGCGCLLSEREAGFGRDESLDDTINNALWEDAVTGGEPWAMNDRADRRAER